MKRYKCNKCGFNFCDYEKKKTCPECSSKDLKETFDDQTDFPPVECPSGADMRGD